MAALVLLASGTFAQHMERDVVKTVSVDADGTVHFPAFAVPLSSYMSEGAQRIFVKQALNDPLELDPTLSISEYRAAVDEYYRPKVLRARQLFPVEIEEHRIAGVRVDVVIPMNGVGAGNRERVLLNLHGGGFTVGGGLGGLAESIPVAGAGAFRVVSIDYRLAPEHVFPAATEDVIAVYKALLDRYEAGAIGIYGCSAGAILTAQTISRILALDLPKPGAIGMFCIGASPIVGGDSRFLSAPLNVPLSGPPPAAAPNPPPVPLAYFRDVDTADPMVSPVNNPELLAEFPPALLISGTRDIGMSSVIHTHRELVAAGAHSELQLWNGMWHNFLFDADMPEAQEAYAVISKFFDRHLAR